ncbi:MAG: 50S ribosomal protein L21 [Oligoflexia bacterium]|nr:50S ribosomal protein L21 [Oligoflexia bacterium]
MTDSVTYAVIKTGGKQYKVSVGSRILVEKLPGEVGSGVTFGEVLLVQAGESSPKIGTPIIKGASVTGKILAQTRAKKVRIYKKNRRTGYTKRQGHRQDLTQVLIENIA